MEIFDKIQLTKIWSKKDKGWKVSCLMQIRVKLKAIDWLPKFATGLNMIKGCSSKSIWVTRLLFCQNDSPMRGSFWEKDSLITHILFELQPIFIFSPVANFGNQSLISFKNERIEKFEKLNLCISLVEIIFQYFSADVSSI